MADSDAGSCPKINLALQGGGAHGAFTWGVLDRLLEDRRIQIEGISGTSAGAMNAAILAQGYLKGGAEGARRELDRFWERLSRYAPFALVRRGFYDRLTGNWNLDESPGFFAFDVLTRLFSPYDLNPLNWHPIREVLGEMIDPAAIAACEEIKLFIAATNVRTGKIRIFEKHEVTIEALLASACLPFVFQAVEIDGDPYWDGGYMGNPAIFPLIYGCESRDVLLVEINPLTRDGVPTTSAEIMNRYNEISFNSSLMREMRAIAFVEKLLDDDGIAASDLRLRRMLIHMIGAGGLMQELGVSSKFNADLEFLLHLKAIGRTAAEGWLAENLQHVGIRSSVDIRQVFL